MRFGPAKQIDQRAANRTKFATMAAPRGVRTDSGWNARPCTGKIRQQPAPDSGRRVRTLLPVL